MPHHMHSRHPDQGMRGFGGHGAGSCGCSWHQHACPACGCSHGQGDGAKTPGLKQMVFMAHRQALMARIEAEIVKRRGDQLDQTARELVDMVEAKMKAKAEMGRKLGGIMDRMMGQFDETGEGQD